MRLSQSIAKTLGGISLLDSMVEGEEAFYLLYSNTNEERFLNKYLKEGFQHVTVLYFNGFHYIKIEPSWSSLSVNTMGSIDGYVFAPYTKLTNALRNKGYTVQRVNKIQSDKLRVPSVLTPFTCVEVAKAMLGIRKFNIFTPYQLYEYCNKSGLTTEE